MRINWLGTTAIAFVIGTGAVMAQQSELPQKREENPHVRTRAPPIQGGRASRRARAAPGRTSARPRGEPAREANRRTARPRGASASPTWQSQDEQKGREAKQPVEPKRQLGREEQPKQDNGAVEERKQLDNRAVEEKRPADAKQQGQREPGRDRNNQAAEPTATPGTQQGARSGDTVRDRERGQSTAPAAEQSARREATSRGHVNEQQRQQNVQRRRPA